MDVDNLGTTDADKLMFGKYLFYLLNIQSYGHTLCVSAVNMTIVIVRFHPNDIIVSDFILNSLPSGFTKKPSFIQASGRPTNSGLSDSPRFSLRFLLPGRILFIMMLVHAKWKTACILTPSMTMFFINHLFHLLLHLVEYKITMIVRTNNTFVPIYSVICSSRREK